MIYVVFIKDSGCIIKPHAMSTQSMNCKYIGYSRTFLYLPEAIINFIKKTFFKHNIMIAVNFKKTKLNILDLLLIITVLFSISGFILAKAEKTGLNKVIEGQENIAIEVLLPDVYLQEITDLFKIGEKYAITIRNRPYTKLKIIKAESKPKQLVIPSLSGTYKTINDPTKPNIRDYFVTLSDTA